jgi:hypothetical protein
MAEANGDIHQALRLSKLRTRKSKEEGAMAPSANKPAPGSSPAPGTASAPAATPPVTALPPSTQEGNGGKTPSNKAA